MEKTLAVLKTKRDKGFTIDYITPKLEVGPNEVLVKVKNASICGTDVHIYDWNKWSDDNITPPRVIGHEFCGEVIEIGKNVKSIKVGDFVSAETHIACGYCYMCKTGNKHICQNMKIIGVHTDGAFTSYIVIPEENAWVNPKNLDPEIASIQEPLGNAVYTVLSDEIATKTVLVTGAGTIGLMAINVAKACGASTIIVSEINEKKAKLAKEMGADIILNPLKDNVLEAVMDYTNGLGVDVGLEMSGNEKALDQLLKSMKKRGRVSLLGIFDSNPVVNFNNDIIFKGLKIYGITGRLMFETWYQLSALLQKNLLNLKPLITHRIRLEEIEKGIEAIKKGDAIKVIVNIS